MHKFLCFLTPYFSRMYAVCSMYKKYHRKAHNNESAKPSAEFICRHWMQALHHASANGLDKKIHELKSKKVAARAVTDRETHKARSSYGIRSYWRVWARDSQSIQPRPAVEPEKCLSYRSRALNGVQWSWICCRLHQ